MPETTQPPSPRGHLPLPAAPYYLDLLQPLAASSAAARAILARYADAAQGDADTISEGVCDTRRALMQVCDSMRLERLPVTPLETAARRQLDRYAASHSAEALSALTAALRSVVVSEEEGRPLFDPRSDASEQVQPVSVALDLARQVLSRSPDVRRGDHAGVVVHATLLDHQLRMLVAAVEAQRGNPAGNEG
ncbi:hypothetical protein [Streptomyces sp. NPDC002159]